ncbi:MAG: N-acetylneuraminate synthase [Bacteroidales bacterium]|nr:N-acetylneuraminate synthase [Bacteroidales bacterium]
MLNKRTFIIAEAGVNHDGNIKKAKKLIDIAKDAGADAVKFQTFKAKTLVTKKANKTQYQKETTGSSQSQYDMLKTLELSKENHVELFNYCNHKGIIFLSSPFDLDSIQILHELGMNVFKIPSGEIVNLPYLEAIGRLNKKVVMSTGMADLGEIEDALDILINSGTLKENITVMHVNTEYPTPMEDVNLYAMLTIKDAFKINVGYSDHTQGIEIPIAAVALGAKVIEKHFTLDKQDEGPDHRASLEPDELKAMVKAIRNIDQALGSGIKQPSFSERPNKIIVRKSIVAAIPISKGEVFDQSNLAIKRPGNGINPMRWYEIIGKKATRDYEPDEIIEL